MHSNSEGDDKEQEVPVATRATSPLRYPGGKASLVALLRETIQRNGVAGKPYYEPFAGGAGAALGLLRQGVVSTVHLNDYDPCVYAFWRAALEHPGRFKRAILAVDVSVDEWRIQRAIYLNQKHRTEKSFELGFATFFLNRCNRSGIIFGSAPIGGYEQKGDWKITARFNKKGLVDRIAWLKKQRCNIELSNYDALKFLTDSVPRGNRGKSVFVYLDPPYYTHGQRLYFSSYDENDHRKLAQYVKRQRMLNWMMSYDDNAFIRGLYGDMVRKRRQIQYSLQKKIRARELLIAPPHVEVPETDRQTEEETGEWVRRA